MGTLFRKKMGYRQDQMRDYLEVLGLDGKVCSKEETLELIGNSQRGMFPKYGLFLGDQNLKHPSASEIVVAKTEDISKSVKGIEEQLGGVGGIVKDSDQVLRIEYPSAYVDVIPSSRIDANNRRVKGYEVKFRSVKAKDAHDRVICSNARLGCVVIGNYLWRILDTHPDFLEDLLSMGIYRGIGKAADYMDYSHGVEFTTYAKYWIKKETKAELRRLLGREERPCIDENYAAIRKIENRILCEKGCRPNDEEIREVMDQEKKDPDYKVPGLEMIHNVKYPVRREKSIGEAFDEADQFSPDNYEPVGNIPSVLDNVIHLGEIRRVMEAIDGLSERDRETLELLYGLKGEIKNKSQIAGERRVTPWAVNLRERKILGKMKKAVG